MSNKTAEIYEKLIREMEIKDKKIELLLKIRNEIRLEPTLNGSITAPYDRKKLVEAVINFDVFINTIKPIE